jgi:hypothetical protein
MKTIFPLFCLVSIGALTLIRAGETPAAVVSSLPPSLYLLSEPHEGGKPDVTYLFTLVRGKMAAMPVFSSPAAAESFRATLPEAQARKLTPVVFPRSFVKESLKRGAPFLFDPKSGTEGGTQLLSESSVGKPSNDNEELQRLFEEDQSDRTPRDGKAIDWPVVGPRDRARQSRIRELYVSAQLKSGADYFHAAMVLQHGQVPEDFLLCHELCIVAISKGEDHAGWLAAASEDRFLMSIGRPQRFGTQFRPNSPGGPLRLGEIGEGVTDELRRELNVPPLAEAKARETKMNQESKEPRQPVPPTPSAVTPAAEPPRQPPGVVGAGLSEAPFVLGPKQFKEGDAIVIQQVLATSPNMAIGDRVVVRGRYLLASKEKATLLLVLTQAEGDGRESVSPTQMIKVEKGTGEFELTYEVKRVGALHLTFYGIADGKPFGGVYFGTKLQMTKTGDGVFSGYEK